MFRFEQNAIVLTILLCLVASTEAKDFNKFKYCKGGYGCSRHDPFFSTQVSRIYQPPATSSWSSCIPNAVKCAFWCQISADCLGFNYFSDGTCSFFKEYSFIIHPLDGCIFYEAKKTTLDSYSGSTDVALRRKTCQSSAAIVGNTIAGAWLLLSQPTCAQTEEPTSGPIWWMIDLEQPIKLDSVTIKTGSFSERLKNTIISVTNNSWDVAEPVRGNEASICFNNELPLYSYTYYFWDCYSSIQPGRYVVIQPEDSSYSFGYFMLCEFQAYPSL